MASNKILSIIIPTYNMERYLRKCLDSLVVPHLSDIEVLVVNDGSKDNSSLIAHEFASIYPKSFKVIDKENGNYGSCINRGLKEATGKYVKILDADDSFNTEQFEQYIIWLLDTDADLILTDYDIVNEAGRCKNRVSYNIIANQMLRFTEVCANKSFLNVSMHAITYKSEIFQKMDYYQSEGISYTDQEWIFTPMSVVENCIYYPILVYRYLYGREGQTMDPSVLVKNISHTMQGVYKMCDDYNKMNRNADNDIYFNYMLNKRCSYIYKNYLIRHPELDINELIAFDTFLRQKAVGIYDLSNHIVMHKILPCHYVRRWRLNNFSANKFYFGILKLIDSMANH